VRRELLRAAGGRRTVTYGFLMRKFRMSRGAPGGRGVVGVLGEVDRREGSNPRLSDAEKRYVRKLQEEVWSYYQAELRDEPA